MTAAIVIAAILALLWPFGPFAVVCTVSDDEMWELRP